MTTLPEEDRSTHETVVEYGVREMMKRKAPKKAAEITAQKLSGSFNTFLGPVVPLIDPKKLEVALWGRLVDQVVSNIKNFKPGAEEMALGAAIDHFRQGKAVEKKVRALVVQRLGRDPFPKKAGDMGDPELRKGLIRLAYEKPELRAEILPLLGKDVAQKRTPHKTLLKKVMRVQERLDKLYAQISKPRKEELEHIRKTQDALEALAGEISRIVTAFEKMG